jgi:hypothetical protein
LSYRTPAPAAPLTPSSTTHPQATAAAFAELCERAGYPGSSLTLTHGRSSNAGAGASGGGGSPSAVAAADLDDDENEEESGHLAATGTLSIRLLAPPQATASYSSFRDDTGAVAGTASSLAAAAVPQQLPGHTAPGPQLALLAIDRASGWAAPLRVWDEWETWSVRACVP